MTSRALSLAALFVLCASAAGACHAPPSDSEAGDEAVGRAGRPIVGGAKASAYPEAVLINMKQSGQIVAACSGSLIAPTVVLTAGHCVYQFDGWDVVAPFASGQKASATSGATLDWTNQSETVDPNMHDVGLVFLSKAINLSSYPKLAQSPIANGAQVVNIGRIDNGTLSDTNLYVSKPITVNNASSQGFPFDYIAKEVIQSGDSGGPDEIPGTHTIVAVNSGAGGGTEVLARVDLVFSWIQQQVAAHGGSGGATGGSGGGSTCAHATCASGGKLAASCDPCAQAICAQDSYCCATAWDSQCVGEVESICGQTCGGGGGDTGGSSGGSSSACGDVTYTGECNGDAVVWCENDALQQIDCSASGATCGYDTQHGYYNCL
jgi:hypothetical protein